MRHPQVQECQSARELPEAGKQKERIPLQVQREGSPADIVISDSGLQSYETVNFCCSRPPTLCHLVTTDLENC